MQEFFIRLGSVQDVQTFVALTAVRDFPIYVRDAYNKVRSDSFMELFCLDFTQPLRVVCDCGAEEAARLKQELHPFLAE